jgi:hypothetical protein
MNLSSLRIKSLRTCNKGQKTFILFVGSRSISFKSCIMRSKPYYMLRNAVENVLLGPGRLFPIYALAALGKSDRFDCQRIWSQATDCILISVRRGRRFTRCLSTDIANHNENHQYGHPSNIQNVGLLLMQRCGNEDDQPVLLKKRNGFSPGSIGSIVSNGGEPKGNGDAY